MPKLIPKRLHPKLKQFLENRHLYNVRGLSIKYVDFSYNSDIFQYIESKFLRCIISTFLKLL